MRKSARTIQPNAGAFGEIVARAWAPTYAPRRMIPVRDRLPTRTVPFINYLLIAANVVFFIWEQALSEAGYSGLEASLGFIPHRFALAPISSAPTILTGDVHARRLGAPRGQHVALWIFGDNVEDAVGHFPLCAFLPARRARRRP